MLPKIRITSPFILIIVLLIAIKACKHEPIIPDIINNPPTVDSTCQDGMVYFENEIFPFIQNNCALSGCHDANTQSNGVDLSSYANIILTADVRPGKADKSDLYKVLDRGEMPPKGYPEVSDSMKLKIYDWINQGARNNKCVQKADTTQNPNPNPNPNPIICDTSNISFSNYVDSIIQSQCIGCHQPPSPSKSVLLDSHANVAIVATNGKLISVLTHASGYQLMPPGGALDSCTIEKIKSWVNAGAPNN
jgi:uncharacterized membrane protein